MTKPMKIKDQNGNKIPYKGIGEEKLWELSDAVSKCLSQKPYVVVAVIGNKGVGKSLLGKYFRNRGFGQFRNRQIAVIDDDNMAIDFFFFRRWHAIPCQGVDELVPFFKYCKRKPVRIYIKSNPETRISKADVVLKVKVDEDRRRRQLIQRKGLLKGEAIFFRTQSYVLETKIDYNIEILATIR